MIIVDNILVSDDLFDGQFCCDLSKCQGLCCVEGDTGAPIAPEEIADLEDNYPLFKKYMSQEGVDKVETEGTFDYDMEGAFVTPLLSDERCAYAYYDEHGVAKCAIEKAFRNGEIDFQKPISCHLYPIRVNKLPDYEALNYHRWMVCEDACELGKRLHLPIFRFLKEPIIRAYGEDFYQKLEARYEDIKAAGGVVFNANDEVLLIYRRGKWDFPKGKAEKGETIEETALREVGEETGLTQLSIVKSLPSTFHTYMMDDKWVGKETYWYVMKTDGQEDLVPQTEEDIVEARWVKAGEVEKLLRDSYPTLQELWKSVKNE
ncbi:MAG: DUF3109 family protein [Bacteroidales bacterium]|nr:DUF3109 family protein [Bacteroidales bacterium]